MLICLIAQAGVDQPYVRYTKDKVVVCFIFLVFNGIYNFISGTKRFVNIMSMTGGSEHGFEIYPVVVSVPNIPNGCW